MARFAFDQIFFEHSDGTLEPRRPIRVGGVSFGPGIRFSKGVAFAGIDFTLFKDRAIDAEEENGVLVIRGIYQ